MQSINGYQEALKELKKLKSHEEHQFEIKLIDRLEEIMRKAIEAY